MIKSAYAVVHFNCGHEKCRRNDTAILDNEDGRFRNRDIAVFEAFSPEYVWAFLKKNFPLFYFDTDIGQAFCELHRKEYE